MTSETGAEPPKKAETETESIGEAEYKASPLTPGATLGAYTIDKRLVSSDSGFTYLANDGRTVVQEYFPQQIAVCDTDGISLLLADAAFNTDFEEGTTEFLATARALSQIDHPGRVAEYEEKDGTSWYAVHMAVRASLADLLATGQRLPEENLKAILYSALTYLEAAHDAGSLHLEITPARILLAEEDKLLLCGFSTDKRHYPPEDTTSSDDYRAPELASFRGQLGRWTDYYALGAVLYHAACKAAPVKALERLSIVDQGGKDPYKPAKEAASGYFSQPTLALIDGLLMLNPSDRPQNASALIKAIQALQTTKDTGQPDTAKADSPKGQRPVKPATRKPEPEPEPERARQPKASGGKSKIALKLPLAAVTNVISTAKTVTQQRLSRLSSANKRNPSPKKQTSKSPPLKAKGERKEPVFNSSHKEVDDRLDFPLLSTPPRSSTSLAEDLEDAGQALSGLTAAQERKRNTRSGPSSWQTSYTDLWHRFVQRALAFRVRLPSLLGGSKIRWRLALGIILGLLVLLGLYLVITPPRPSGTSTAPAKIEILGGTVISPDKPEPLQIADATFGSFEKHLSEEQDFSHSDDLARINAYRDADRLARLSGPHLLKADEFMRVGALIAPADANAYSEYASVLRIDPDNLAAKNGMGQILSLLIGQIDKHVQSLEFDAARELFSEVETRFPDESQVAENGKSIAAAEVAYREAQKAKENQAKLEAQNLERERERQKQIELLLVRALKALDEERLISPPGDNALTMYRSALDLDPANQRARNGIGNISSFYLQQTREALSINDLDEASRFLEIASSISPDDQDVVNLGQQLKRRQFLETESKRLQDEASSNIALAQNMANEQDQLKLQSGVRAYYAGDYRQAFQYLEPLANRNDPQAQVRVARMLMEGRGVDRDKPKAIAIFGAALAPVQLAASQGQPWAQSDLADYYFDGLVIDKDYRTAAFWYQKAAEQGYAPAQTNLGWLYFNGYDGVAPNRAVAIYWFSEAASQGNQTAANNLRSLGEDVPTSNGG